MKTVIPHPSSFASPDTGAHEDRDFLGMPVNDTSSANQHGVFPSEVITRIADNPFEHVAVTNTSRLKQIWAIGGGKGGVGKSLISSSIAIALARLGQKVIAVDLDLGGANLHTAVGLGLPKRTLFDFLGGRTPSLRDCVTPSGIAGLELISGAQDSIHVTNLSLEQKALLIQSMKELDADYLIVDLGAGTAVNTIDFFLAADLGIVVMLPEPTSIENAYRFIKSAYFRRLMVSPKLGDIRSLIDVAMDSKNSQGIKTPTDLFREVSLQHPETALRLRHEIQNMHLKLIVNQARTQTDIDIGFSVKSVCQKYFGVQMDYVGCLDYDSAAWQATRRKRSLMLEFPNSQVVSSIDRITQYLLKRYGHIRNSLF